VIEAQRLAEIEEATRRVKVAVVGDLMLDEFLVGSVARISPEAPVPVLEYRSHEYVLGGAGNAARTLQALGASASVVGVVGSDHAGRTLVAEAQASGLPTGGIVVAPTHTTTLKTRVIAQSQQVLRIDREVTEGFGPSTRRAVREALDAAVAGAGALLVSDYDKGLMSPAFAKSALALARERRIPVVVDTKASHVAYRNATVLTPNVAELAKLVRMRVSTERDLDRAAAAVMRRFEPGALVVTRAEKGMSLFRPQGRTDIAALATEVSDVTGAGDTVAAVLALALAQGMDLVEAAELATLAAAVVVRKVGTATPEWSEMRSLAGR
jgi:D-beta-D-heptose 7-phosphate kinase/D-beta-D-heptose 1-phosphate adenosyltransferase